MGITVFSFVMAVIWSAIFVVIIYFIRKNNNMKKYFGIKLIAYLYIFCIIRMFFPLEFSFTKVIPMESFYNEIYNFIHLNKIGETNISLLNIFIFIWIFVAVIKITRFIYRYNKTSNKILALSAPCNSSEWVVLNKIKLELDSYLIVNIKKSDLISIPIALGVFKKHIILPNKEYSERELYYILIHEYTHFLNKDTLIKIMSNIFCYLFWWILPFKLLIKDLEQVLEIKCDLDITKEMDDKCKTEYMTAIVSSLKNITNYPNENIIGTALLNVDNKSDIMERFEAIINSKTVKHNANYLIICLISFMCILSYSFIIQPNYEAPQNTNYLNFNDAYILKTKDGKFLFFLNEEFRTELTETAVKALLENGYKLIEE